MKLSIVIPIHNQIPLARACYAEMVKHNSNAGVDTEFIIIDNFSDSLIQEIDFPGAKIVHNGKNTGVYPTFDQGMKIASGDIVAFFHSDLVIWEPNWNLKVLDRFIENDKLGLAGFIGSNEIDALGGRGLGTASNFAGRELRAILSNGATYSWNGSSWEIHGAHLTDFMKAAVVDGCAMIIRREAWEEISYREDFPPHHFYDRLISCQMLDVRWEIEVIGVECDHISGQTVNQEPGYQNMAYQWLSDNKKISELIRWNNNYDSDIYKISEEMWLNEYKDIKHLIPIRV